MRSARGSDHNDAYVVPSLDLVVVSTSAASVSDDERYTYAEAGVDIAAGNALVKAIAPLAKATARPGADAAASWTPDGRSVAYINATADSIVHSKFWDGSGEAMVIARTKPVSELGYSAANRLLVLRTSSMASS